ncbi:hypothetical protein PQB81_gp012 [Arthrobacter phage Kardesai]|uniref:DUF7253 domain-containing protein n=1 Tax=Arthrobacter phage Kardesai TaxID=2859474 RepID=A0AAE7SMU6_9CAUD|nr:hypothetical protein PQB81_gp012 [Arthrobacter phage Kardesai]QXO12919.1 hypothetical protein SEA_KARDESAI_12 [Arthrobacter phage Kardesai]
MARFYGEVGYVDENVEIRPGVMKDVVVEFSLYGDVLRNTRRLDSGEKVNDDLSVGNSISVVADAYANENFHKIRYVKWNGARWKVTEVEVEAPRLKLRLGGVYNGPTPPTP